MVWQLCFNVFLHQHQSLCWLDIAWNHGGKVHEYLCFFPGLPTSGWTPQSMGWWWWRHQRAVISLTVVWRTSWVGTAPPSTATPTMTRMRGSPWTWASGSSPQRTLWDTPGNKTNAPLRLKQLTVCNTHFPAPPAGVTGARRWGTGFSRCPRMVRTGPLSTPT